MNKDMENKSYVQETFGEIHAPESLRRKVMNMTQNDVERKRTFAGKRLAVAAAIVVILFAGSNGVVYAMTGSTWVENLTGKMNINGVWQDVELEGRVREDGLVEYSKTLDVSDGDSVQLVVITEGEPDSFMGCMDYPVELSRTEVVEEDGRIYFVDGDMKIDITEDMEDGYATGSFDREGAICQYEVKQEPGVPGCYELHILSEE